MIHWRHEEDKKKGKDSQSDGLPTSSTEKGTTRDASVRSKHTSSISTRTRRSDSFQPYSGSSEQPHKKQLYSSSNAELDLLGHSPDLSVLVDAGSSRWQLTAPETASYFPQYRKQTQTITNKAVTDYEESERHEARQLRTMVVGLATFYNVVGSHDAFEVLPQFRNPNLDALYLSRNCESAPSIPRADADVFRCARVCF